MGCDAIAATDTYIVDFSMLCFASGDQLEGELEALGEE